MTFSNNAINSSIPETTEEQAVKAIRKGIWKNKPKFELSDISSSELEDLCQRIGYHLDFNHSDYISELAYWLSFDRIRHLDPHYRLLAGRVVAQFLHWNFGSTDVMNRFLNPPICKDYNENTKGQRVWSFNHHRQREMQSLIRDFKNVYGLWFMETSSYVRYHLYEHTIEAPQIPIVARHMEKFRPWFFDFLKRLDGFIDPLIDEFAGINCNMKNFLHYFGLLSRFHNVYRVAREGFVKKARLRELGNLLGRARYRYDMIFYRAPLLRLLGNLVREAYFSIDNDDSPISMAVYQEVLTDLGDQLSFALKGMQLFNRRMERYYSELKFIIFSLEDAASITSTPFDELDFSSSVIVLSNLAAIITLIIFCA